MMNDDADELIFERFTGVYKSEYSLLCTATWVLK